MGNSTALGWTRNCSCIDSHRGYNRITFGENMIELLVCMIACAGLVWGAWSIGYKMGITDAYDTMREENENFKA